MTKIDHWPDFSDGDRFLADLRRRIDWKRRRQNVMAGVASAVSTVLIFALSFMSLQRQADEELWQEYLLSQNEDQIWLEMEGEVLEEIYLSSLYDEEDLDVLLEALIDYYGNENLLKNIKMEG